MTPRTPARLAIAVTLSAMLHAAVLVPLKAPSGLFVSMPFSPSPLNVRVQMEETLPADAAGALPPDTSYGTLAADSPASASHIAPIPAQVATAPAGRMVTDERIHATTQTGSPVLDTAQDRTRVRVALPNEVNVFVHRYDPKAEENPNETIELAGSKYFYFNAPQLTQSTRPTADAAPQYPVARLDYPHGAVNLLLFIDEQGKIEKTAVECANPAFEESAVASTRDMRFAAARSASGPVKSYMKVEFRYGLGTPCGRPPLNLQQVVNPAASSR